MTAAAERAIQAARIHVLMERGDRRARAWVGSAGAVIAHPAPDGGTRTTIIPPSLIVDALVSMNDVGPRPRPEPAVRIQAAPGALAEALAARDPSPLRLGDREQAEAFARLIAGLREHWRVSVRWDPAEGALGGRDLEVVDSDAGYWLVVPDDPTVELWPTTPTTVFRELCRLFPLATELRA